MSLARESLELSLQFADKSHREHLPRHRVAHWLRAALESPARITVRIVGADVARKALRRIVLTFDYQREPVVLADLVLCAPVVEREALADGKTLAAHYAHLLVHGALHAQGYDHDIRRAAERMEARESEVLLALGHPDPHAR